MIDGFKTGSGCFKCDMCGKLTRSTKDTEYTRLCPHCYRVGEMENAINDGHYNSEEDVNESDREIYREALKNIEGE